MLISEFAKSADLTTDTVRFYMRSGLLEPHSTQKGGRRPYAIFSARDLDRATKIRILQFLGYSLREIGALVKDDAEGRLTVERSKKLLEIQLTKLTEKRSHLNKMISFVKDRITSLDDDSAEPPDFRKYIK